MAKFDEHTLNILEYFKIISILKGRCLTPYGISAMDRTLPSSDIEAINIRLDEVSQMKEIILFGMAFPLYRIEDVTGLIEKSRTEGTILEPKELLSVKELIEVSADLHNYNKDDREHFPLIADYLVDLHPFPDIIKAINKAIDKTGEILDSASGKLKNLRREIGNLKGVITSRLMGILSRRQKSPGWQDDTVMIRDGRYVIPMIAGQFRPESGIIHDRSQSGATLYIEPNEIIELNNKLGLIMQQERLEIDRILKELSAMIGAGADRLMCNCELIGILDSIHAAADFSIKTDGTCPSVKERSWISLKQARHPLLIYYTDDRDKVIANDFELNDSRQVLIITGPNTGGKTVALKTVGLLVLMAQSGFHIPAHENSTVGIFENVFADIGDEQSIELSLSTFSSHIRTIINTINQTDENCLVLFDEIGAGTDPKEGAALAEAIILKLLDKGSRTIVTTHYSQLKTLPMLHPEIENASFEFDRESLQPTFRLYIGIPGASYAVEIARRLGMHDDIADKAAELIGKGERSLTGLIESLEKELAILRKDKAALEEKLESASRLEKQYSDQTEQFKKDVEDIRKRQIDELGRKLTDARKNIEILVKEIRESRASQEAVKKAHRFLRESDDDIKRLKTEYGRDRKSPDKLEPGDKVLIESFRREGEFVEFVGGDMARKRIGNIMSTVKINELKKIMHPSAQTGKKDTPIGMRDLTAPGPEIHLRGMTVDEATEALDKFLDSAVLSGMHQIYVVHGKGSGALRKGLGHFLKNHKAVASIRLGNWNEGGAGVTVVKLKE